VTRDSATSATLLVTLAYLHDAARVLVAVWIATVLLACAPRPRIETAPVADASPHAQVARPDDVRSVVEILAAAQRRYLEARDLRPLEELYALDLRVESGRTDVRSAHDNELGREGILSVYRWALEHEERMTFRHDVVRVDQSGAAATLVWRYHEGHGDHEQAFGERYDLERREGAWRIVHLRYWPLRPDTDQPFGEAYFADLDHRIDRALADDDKRTAAYLLMLAYRMTECAVLARTLTDETPDDAWAWHMREKASAVVGDGPDAELAAQRAKGLE
jgi:hypothetical protein